MTKTKRRHGHCCDEMAYHLSEGELALTYSLQFREYGIRYLDGGTSTQLIRYCPWCGARLPDSLRDLWFDEVFALGLEPGDPRLPKRYKSDEWYKKKSN